MAARGAPVLAVFLGPTGSSWSNPDTRVRLASLLAESVERLGDVVQRFTEVAGILSTGVLALRLHSVEIGIAHA
ncbi:hypothetical protein [Halalkalicoccus subterraneus]|uniref:hypothetical protein n=1 Tax=Halalkalicoccus subterraneus TaxID=2675002 RepID=UPI0013CF2323|nr:hypothetical protein [Halalkalicoccus subterraneus]